MFIFLPIFVILGIVGCIVSYWKSKDLENTQTPVSNTTNRRYHVSSTETRTDTEICIVPTTSQVMEIFNTQANTAAGNNTTETPGKTPPSYGTVIMDEPPSYEQAVVHL